jgi:hypothetical protein
MIKEIYGHSKRNEKEKNIENAKIASGFFHSIFHSSRSFGIFHSISLHLSTLLLAFIYEK